MLSPPHHTYPYQHPGRSPHPTHPQRLCYHPASVGCRFRFLHLALRHEQHSLGTLPPTPSTPSSHTHTPPTTHTVVDVSTNAQLLVQQRGERMPSVLRCERILRAALMWGSAPVTWYGRWTTTEARCVLECGLCGCGGGGMARECVQCKHNSCLTGTCCLQECVCHVYLPIHTHTVHEYMHVSPPQHTKYSHTHTHTRTHTHTHTPKTHPGKRQQLFMISYRPSPQPNGPP